ncbi:MAG: FtsX-like permease family protein [Chloroflexales bacterium]|nr:FtsX-like permease family protein [Chloroflexales bacterium]
MLRPRWKKVIRDLAFNRTRTALVVLSIAVGVFAFGTIMAGRIVLQRELRTSFLATNPASAIITTEPFDDDLVEAVRGLPNVAEAQGRRAVAVRIQTGPEAWQDTVLYVLPNDGVTEVGIVKPWQGAWPAPDNAILIERASLAKTRSQLGGLITLQLSGHDARSMPIAGLTHDLSLPPAVISGQVFGYITFDTLEWLGGPQGYNQLAIVVEGDRTDEAHIRAVAADVERLIERGGREVLNTDVPTPLQHPVEVILPTLLAIMATIGSLALLISTFLIINTISAILTQQTRQIGVMKAIGARAGQIAGMYFVLAASFGLLALVIAVPLSYLGGLTLTGFLSSQLNVDIVGFQLPPQVLLIELAAALLVPLVAAAAPIRGVTHRPAREALAGDTAAPAEPTPIDRLISRMRHLTRPTRLALRNTFRRKGRLARTLVALALGGAVFVSAMTLRASLFTTLDESIASQRYDVEVQFSRPYRVARVAPAALAVPGVTSVEALLRDTAFPVRADGSTGDAMSVRAMPAGTAMFSPRMSEGRWLLPGDDHAIVLSTNIKNKEPGTRVGDELKIKIGDDEQSWRVVGFIEELQPPVNPVLVYISLDAYTRVYGGVGRTDTLRVATVGHDPASHKATAEAMERQLESDGYDVRLIHSRSEDRAILAERFNLISVVLSIMATLIGIVGGLGLAGTMSINVLERTREIGIMRAVGAADRAVRQIVVSEGLVIACLAWLIGTIISLPMSYAMCYAFGLGLLNTPLTWTYALPAVAIWLGAVLLIALVASLLPARSAVRLTVREVLAYE